MAQRESSDLAVPERVRAVGSSPRGTSLPTLRAHLAQLMERGDLGVLGVRDNPTLKELHVAYCELSAHWHPIRFAASDEAVREVVAEIAIRFEGAYRRLTRSNQRLAQITGHASARVATTRPRSTPR